MTFVTNQKLLAKKLKYSEVHISLFKNHKDAGHSQELLEKLAYEFGVEPIDLERASAYKRNKIFKKHFADQRLLKLASKVRVRG